MLKAPILLLIYNRPKYTRQVFEAIRSVRPQKLFISADGPKDRADLKLCKESRDVVSSIDWPCEVLSLYRNSNLGCKQGMISGIDWFFENVEQGIILEDDCLPNKSFFTYCEILLDRYEHNQDIMMISGSNPATSIDLETDYFFSYFFHVWGWATWKRAWSKYDENMSDWPKLKKGKFLDKRFPYNMENKIFTEQVFDQMYKEGYSTWDVQWAYTCMINEGCAILPTHNLISNIGLTGTHQMSNDQLKLETREIDFNNFKHPSEIKIDYEIENYLFEKSGLKRLIRNNK